ncbi:MAG: quinohemoprotein amine dehydrogenase subunit alpha [Pseudomonadota bacterium]
MRALLLSAVMAFALTATSGTIVKPAAAQDAESLLNARCSACHARLAEGGLSRISDQRKTPEGWDMTVTRMIVVHGLKIAPEEKHAVVKHLADTLGLAPSESRGWRYALERTPGATDSAPNDDLATMCARCHTFARVALQRRTPEEWVKSGHFHIGQYPTTEYQFYGRDRPWFDLATGPVAEELAKMLPLDSDEWRNWQQVAKRDLSGVWRITGHQPGTGSYQGQLNVQSSGGDRYDVSMSLTYDNGASFSAEGQALVFTNHEWRASLSTNNERYRQVASVAEDGKTLSGRWFVANNDIVGGTMNGTRIDAGHQVLSVLPGHLKAGSEATLTIAGVGMTGEAALGDGIQVLQTLSASPEAVVVKVRAAADAATGARNVAVGEASGDGLLVVYDKVDTVRVEPDTTFSRVGGGGGPIPAVPAQFEAIGYMNGDDKEPGTEDDVRIGVLPAAWSVTDFSEAAAALKDAHYAGTIDQFGYFTPAVAGPNPERKFGTNNVGDLSVIAVVDDSGSKVEGRGHLFATVQRYIDPPIR